MSKKEEKAKESIHKYFMCKSEKYGCREKEYCQFCNGKNTAHDCDEDCQADIYNEGFYAGWDEALKSQVAINAEFDDLHQENTFEGKVRFKELGDK